MTKKRRNRCIITISDNLSPFSMPYNEFAMYRYHHFKDEKQIFIVLFDVEINSKVQYFEDFEVYRTGWDIKKLRYLVNDLLNKYYKNGYEVVFHIHEAKSVIFFNAATFCKYRNHILYTVHSTYTRYKFHNKLFNNIATFFSKKVICVSETSYKYFPNILKKIFSNKIEAIQNGVDVDRIHNVIDGVKKKKDEYLNLVYVARFTESKRHEIIVNAIRKIDGVKLFFIGTGNCEKNIKELVSSLNIENKVFFLGEKSREEVYTKMVNSDVYVSSSEFEGLPIAVLEAMSCGIVCLLSNIEQHKEIANKCKGLILVDNQIESWSREISKLMYKKYDIIGEKNRSDVREYFSLEKMHNKYTKIYDEIVK